MTPDNIALALIFLLPVLGLAVVTYILEEFFGYGGGGR